ncbi:MAG: hypothetical protein IKM41_01715 [Tidjanibacter sp.]|nr:hypothetical protein [Tidjanibacter sp.]MBR3853258.1 hypothetical protein [Tidjanibacter sp.]
MSKAQFITTLLFESTNDQTTINNALTAAFPNTECPANLPFVTFESESLCDAIIDCYFANADQLKASVAHEFDMRNEFEVWFRIGTDVQPILRSSDLASLLPADSQFSAPCFDQSLE